MATSVGIIGKGSTIGYSAYPTPSSYTLLAEVTGEIPFPNIQVDADVDMTNFASPSNHVETKANGWLKTDEIDLELTYVQSQHSTLVGLIGTDKTWQITLPDTHTVTYAGYIKSVGGSIPNKDRVTTKVKVYIKGLATFS